MAKEQGIKENSTGKNTREWIQLIIIIFTAAVSAYGVFLKDIWSPSQESACLNVDAHLENEGDKGDLTLIRAQISVYNSTKKRIEVPALWYSVIGYKVDASGKVAAHYQRDSICSKNRNNCFFNYGKYESEVVAQQKMISEKDTAWWKPDEKMNTEFIVAVPLGHFDFVSLEVGYLTTRYIEYIDSVQWFASDSGQWYATCATKPNINTFDPPQLIGPKAENWRTRFGTSSTKTILMLNKTKKPKDKKQAEN